MDATRRQRILRSVVTMALGMALALLLTLRPLAALRDAPMLALMVGMGAWTVAENLVLKQDEPKDYATKRQTRIMQAAVMLAVGFAVIDVYHMPTLLTRAAWVSVLGAFVLAAGAGLRIVSIRTLDRHFSYEVRVEKDHELVERGVYGVLRHPSYLGIILVCLGAALLLGSLPGALAGGALMSGIVVWRIATEERVLRAGLGSAYDEYARRTWRLVPFVY